MNMGLLDKYIVKLIEKNGWFAGRRFNNGDYWMKEIEQYGYPSFELARQIIYELGGLSFLEYAPLTYQRMMELRQKDGQGASPDFAADIKTACENCLKIRLFRGNGGCFPPTTPVFMLIRRFSIFGWEAEPSNPSIQDTPYPAYFVYFGSRMPCG